MNLTLRLEPTFLGGLDLLSCGPCRAGLGVQTTLKGPEKALTAYTIFYT